SATDFPFRFTIPYSVTRYITSDRGVVTIFPGVRLNTILLRRSPRFSYVDERHIKDFPPFDAYAPRTNCNCPPVPLRCRFPSDSEATCPCRSTCVVLLIDTAFSFCMMMFGEFV